MSDETSPKRGAKRRGLGRIYARPNSPSLWVEYWHLGKRYRESCGSHLEEVAKRLLRKRLGEISHKGRVVGPAVENLTYEDLERLLLEDYRARGVRSLDNVEKYRLPYLRAGFAGCRVVEMRKSALVRYAARRKRNGAAPDTIRQELKLLRAMFGHALADEMIEHLPAFPKITQSPPREGSCTPEQMRRLADHLPAHLRLLAWTMYLTGWRGKHVREMTWAVNVNLRERVLYLPAEPDNKKRSTPLWFHYGESEHLAWFAALLEDHHERHQARQRRLGRVIREVFTDSDGAPIGSFKSAWISARKKAGLPDLRPHDLRRSATENSRRAGVDRRVRKATIGHASDRIHDDYDRASIEDRAEAVRRLGAYIAKGLTDTQTDTQAKARETSAG